MTTAVDARVGSRTFATTTGPGSRVRDRLPLLLILLLQIVIAYRLTNTAFEDEALYIYAGHRELGLLLHGTPTYDNYAGYFSGAPFLYPVLAALVDTRFGLEGVRVLSLLAMLGATTFVWMTARRLYGRPAAVVGSALFAVAAPTLFMSRLATYDALAVFLLALALWLVVRTAGSATPLVLSAAPPLVLALGIKYASGLYLPSVAAAAVLAVPAVSSRPGGTRVWLRGVVRGALLATTVAGLAAAALVAAQRRPPCTRTCPAPPAPQPVRQLRGPTAVPPPRRSAAPPTPLRADGVWRW